MRSTFMGLEASKRGLFTQQSALYTTGHNIANANTDGYSRQRVNMTPTLGYPGVGLNAPKTAGFIGTGVQAEAVQRIRDKFTDMQFRQESNKLGYWESRTQSIAQMEDILNEPSDYGLAKSLDQFWNSLQDLNVRPEDGGARAVVIQRGIAVADSFNYLHTSIQQLEDNAGREIGILLKDANSTLQQISAINDQIQAIEPNGYMPNDLYDARDNLLDKLSTFFPIETEYGKSGGNALPIAEGPVKVSMKLKDGTKIELVNGKEFSELKNLGSSEADGITPNSMVTGLKIISANGSNDISIDNISNLGKYRALVDSYGYSDNGTEKGLFPEMIVKLNNMASEFANEFNKIHKAGYDLTQPSSLTNAEFFISKDGGGISAENIYVLQSIIDNPNLFAASTDPDEPGNGINALLLAKMKSKEFEVGVLKGYSIQSYLEGLIGQLGVDGQQASSLAYNAQTLQQAVTERRDSISSVSLDEEMTNMITFQQAYNANARMVTVIDETLDKIINGMGRVGL